LCGTREVGAGRSIGTFAGVAVFPEITPGFIELAGVARSSALREITTLTRCAARKKPRAFFTKWTLEANAPILVVDLTGRCGSARIVFHRRSAVLCPVVKAIAVRVALENTSIVDANVPREALRRFAFAFANAL
jgi:hypothetical protein